MTRARDLLRAVKSRESAATCDSEAISREDVQQPFQGRGEWPMFGLTPHQTLYLVTGLTLLVGVVLSFCYELIVVQGRMPRKIK
jgi:hypothetical protein